MDTGRFMFSPLPFVYRTYPPPSSSHPTRIQLQINLALPLAMLIISLSLLAVFPWQLRSGRKYKPHDRTQPRPISTRPTSSPRPRTSPFSLAADRHRLRLQRQNVQLTASVRNLQLALRHNAFAAFRDRLLLSNRIWAHQKQIALIHTDPTPVARLEAPDRTIKDESLTPSAEEQIRVLKAKIAELEQARIDDAAARDALDEQREILLSKLINEIAADLEESQWQVERLRAKLGIPAQQDTEAPTKEVLTTVDETKFVTEPAIEAGDPEEVKPDIDQTPCEDAWITKISQTSYDSTSIPTSPTPDRSALDDLFSDPGSPTPTVAGDDDADRDMYYDTETDYASDVMPESPHAFKLRSLESPPLTPRSPSPPPSPLPLPPSPGLSRPLPFPRPRAQSMMNLGSVHPQSPGALALGSSGEKPYTTSARLLARCARAKSAFVSGRRALRFPTWSQQPSALGPVAEAGESTVSLTTFPGWSKRPRANSESSGS